VLLVLACASGPVRVSAQTIYRCGNTYSQVPCPGGREIDANDSRSAAQKVQTDAAARQAASSALRMERERLALEQSVRVPAAGKHSTAQASKPRDTTIAPKGLRPDVAKKKAGAEPEHFTAAVWDDGTKPRNPGDKSPAKAEGKAAGKPTRP